MKVKNAVWYLPEAPYLVDKGTNSFSWTYEISDGKYERDEPISLILNFLKDQILSRFNSKDVYLLGFSQGALICFEIMRILKEPLGGIFPIGGFMSIKSNSIRHIHPNQINTPIVIGHGKDDNIVSVEESIMAYELLSKESSKVELDTYKGGHKIGYSYIKKVKGMIEKQY